MATKNLSRTVIEGGRAGSNQYDRYLSNEIVRGQSRAFCSEASRVSDLDAIDDLDDTIHRRPVPKDFTDKLAPMYRWLRKQVNRPWNKVFAELTAKFDTRTVAGRHVVYSHLLNDVTLKLTEVHGGRGDFYVDEHGILRLSKRNRWNRHASRASNGIGYHEIFTWLAERRIRDLNDDNLFWELPEGVEWRECGWYTKRGRYDYLGTVYVCRYDRHAHRDGEKLVRVEDATKLLAIDKARFPTKTLPNGDIAYFRPTAIKLCPQPTGSYRSGSRFSTHDMEIWRKVSESQIDYLHSCGIVSCRPKK